MKCPGCDGYGYYASPNQPTTDWCPVCKGTGKAKRGTILKPIGANEIVIVATLNPPRKTKKRRRPR